MAGVYSPSLAGAFRHLGAPRHRRILCVALSIARKLGFPTAHLSAEVCSPLVSFWQSLCKICCWQKRLIPVATSSFVAAADLNGDQLANVIGINPADNTVSVSLNATPAFTLSASSQTLNVGPEQASDTLSLLSVNGFSFSVQLSCQVTGPAPLPACSQSPEDVTPETSAATATLNLSPASSAASRIDRLARPLYAAGLPFAFLAICLKKRKPGRGRCVLLIVVLAVSSLVYTACGGSNGAQLSQQESYLVDRGFCGAYQKFGDRVDSPMKRHD